MQKRVIIIHGWESGPTEHWFPWLKSELEKNGFEVLTPQMPNTFFPRQAEWVSYKVLHKCGHFSQGTGNNKFPELVEELLEKNKDKINYRYI